METSVSKIRRAVGIKITIEDRKARNIEVELKRLETGSKRKETLVTDLLWCLP